MNSSFSRRAFLGASIGTAAMAALAACSTSTGTTATSRILATDPLVAEIEGRRLASGITVNQKLVAGFVDTTVAGTPVRTWGYNQAMVAPTIRAKAGDMLDVELTNNLSDTTSIHWHGLALRNDADGVGGLTQSAVKPGSTSGSEFRLQNPGTYWYHSHMDMQRERALYGALIIEDPKETLSYDQEWVIVLDDWLDGITGTPDEVFAELSKGGSMPGMDMGMKYMLMGATSHYLGGDAGDVKIPVHLFNGTTPSNPEVFPSSSGNRIRLRIINAAGDTAYRIGIPGQKITLTHSDGFPVKHEDVDAVVLAMGERIDAIVTVQEGTTAIVALAEGKEGAAYGFVMTAGGTAPSVVGLPTSFSGVVTDGGRLKADESVLLTPRSPNRVHEMRLTGTMSKYNWGINGKQFDMNNPFADSFNVAVNDRIRIKITNETAMWHPMHLHGHTFQLGADGARKDTVIVRPKQTVVLDFDGDNPGQWLAHCHNAYHAGVGMIGVLSYVR